MAARLLRQGIVGAASRDSKGSGSAKPATEFQAGEYITAARVHLGMSAADAEQLSMSEFQALFEMKFPTRRRKSAMCPARGISDGDGGNGPASVARCEGPIGCMCSSELSLSNW